MTHPIVSVIIPTYKRNKTLERAIKSVLRQTFKNYEIIIVDDNDEKSKYRKHNEIMMRKYQNNEKIIYLKHKKNLNGAAARNTGIFHSKSKYIAFLDDDDEYLENKLELQINLLEKLDNSWGGVFCGCNHYIGRKLIRKNLNLGSGNLKNDLLLKKIKFSFGSTALLRRSVLNELNGFDDTFNRYQDGELLIRFFRKYKIAFINQVLVNGYFDDRKNVPDTDSLIRTNEKILKKYKKDIDEMPKDLQMEVYKRHSLEIVRAFIRRRELKGALNYYKKAKMYTNLSVVDYFKIIIHFIYSMELIRQCILIIIIKISGFVKLDIVLNLFMR